MGFLSYFLKTGSFAKPWGLVLIFISRQDEKQS